MNQKTKCKKCGLEIDSDLSYCPYCGTPQAEETKDDSTQQANESVPSNEPKERSIKFFRSAISSFSCCYSVGCDSSIVIG